MLDFLFRVVFDKFSIIPVEIENAKLKLALAISTGAPLTVANYVIDMPPVVADQTVKELSK